MRRATTDNLMSKHGMSRTRGFEGVCRRQTCKAVNGSAGARVTALKRATLKARYPARDSLQKTVSGYP